MVMYSQPAGSMSPLGKNKLLGISMGTSEAVKALVTNAEPVTLLALVK